MSLPTLIFEVSSPGLSAEEQALANALGEQLQREQADLLRCNDYYEGTFRVRHLGIAVPPNLQDLRTVIGWPGLAVDTIDERCLLDGFRLADAGSADEDLADIFAANGLEQQSHFAHVDAMVFSRGFVIGGSTEGDDMPLLTVESPLNMTAEFDAVRQQVRNALQVYETDGEQRVALYTPDATVHLHRPEENGPWEVFSRDDHRQDAPPVVMLPNRTRTHARYGRSEITPAVQYLNDGACRTLLGMEITREFFAAQQRYILGAEKDPFVNPDGTPTAVWETYIGRYLSIERDNDGEVPTVGSFPAQDPTPFVALIQDYARRFAAVTGLPPHMVGYSADNPASADGIRSAEARLDRRAGRKHANFTPGWRQVAQMMLRLAGLPAVADPRKLVVDWQDPSTPTEMETAQALYYQVSMGYLPPTSDVIGQRLGYSAAVRARIDADRRRAQTEGALNAITQRLANKYGGTDGSTNGAPQPGADVAAGPGDGRPDLGVRGAGGGVPRLRLGAGRG